MVGMTLRVAVPNKGSLSAEALQLFADAGYRAHRRDREIRTVDTVNDLEFFFQRPKDIATYVGTGTLDAGVTGLDLIANTDAPVEPILELGFAWSQFRLAGRPGEFTEVAELAGRRVATSFPGLLAKHLAEHGVDSVEIVSLDGAVENAIELDVADAVADVVETGGSLRNANLVAFGEPVLTSQAVLVKSTRRKMDEAQLAAMTGLTNRLQGVLHSRTYALIDYDCPKAVVEQACALTPGMESPTISPLADPEWVAVRTLVPRRQMQPIMDELYAIGCKAILVTSLEACRLV